MHTHLISSHLISSHAHAHAHAHAHPIASYRISSLRISSHLTWGAPGPDFAHFFWVLAGALKKADKLQKSGQSPQKIRTARIAAKTLMPHSTPPKKQSVRRFCPFWGVHPHSQPAAKKSGQTQKSGQTPPKIRTPQNAAETLILHSPPLKNRQRDVFACFLGAPP